MFMKEKIAIIYYYSMACLLLNSFTPHKDSDGSKLAEKF